MIPAPANAVAAVVHPDPYPWYARLAALAPFHREGGNGGWLALDPASVTEVLTTELCSVRPVEERVPRALAGAPGGDLFARFARMSDGAEHVARRGAAEAAMTSFTPDRVASVARAMADGLVDRLSFDAFAFALPVRTVAALLGTGEDALAATEERVRRYVAGYAPGADAAAQGSGREAALDLLAWAAPDGLDDPAAAQVGLLVQTFEATAALIALTWSRMVLQPVEVKRGASDPTLLDAYVREVARFDPPVQNTRRWVVRDGVIAGHHVSAGDAIVAVLAAANRSPEANPDPHEFDAWRKEPRSFTFGVGPHACPGEALAVAITRAGIEALVAHGHVPAHRRGGATYRPSINIRHPLFD